MHQTVGLTGYIRPLTITISLIQPYYVHPLAQQSIACQSNNLLPDSPYIARQTDALLSVTVIILTIVSFCSTIPANFTDYADNAINSQCIHYNKLTMPPRRKKLYSSTLSLPAASRILAHMWNENSSLCRSNSPRHAYLHHATGTHNNRHLLGWSLA